MARRQAVMSRWAAASVTTGFLREVERFRSSGLGLTVTFSSMEARIDFSVVPVNHGDHGTLAVAMLWGNVEKSS